MSGGVAPPGPGAEPHPGSPGSPAGARDGHPPRRTTAPGPVAPWDAAARPPPLHPGVHSAMASHGAGHSHRATPRGGAGAPRGHWRHHSRGDSDLSGHDRLNASDALSELGPDTSYDLTPYASQADLGDPRPRWLPTVRLGSAEDIGGRAQMEDAVCLIQDLAALLPEGEPVPASWRAAGPAPGRGGGAEERPLDASGVLSEDGDAEDPPHFGDVSQILEEGSAPPGSFMAVFDGHHGPGAARYAASALARHLVRSPAFPGDMAAALGEAFRATDRDLREYTDGTRDAGGGEGPVPDGVECTGTTGLAAVVWGATLWLANCGDCRAVLSRRGKAVTLTKDHKPVEEGERARIVALGGKVCPEGRVNGDMAVSRALGDWHLEEKRAGMILGEPEVSSCELRGENDFLILACDGLWDVMDSGRCVETAKIFLRNEWDAGRCARHLADEAVHRRGATDNVSVVVATLRQGPLKVGAPGLGLGFPSPPPRPPPAPAARAPATGGRPRPTPPPADPAPARPARPRRSRPGRSPCSTGRGRSRCWSKPCGRRATAGGRRGRGRRGRGSAGRPST